MRKAAVALCCALALSTSGAGAATETPVTVAPAVAAALDAIVKRGASGDSSAPAVSVAIVENGKLAYERAAGYEDLASKRAATPQTRFRIASITKTFTAVSVMQLVERGKMALDAPLATYLPDVGHAREVTIRQLLMHTSGIPNYGDVAFSEGSIVRATTPAAIVASMTAKPLDFAPGSRYGYSNTGYVLLGLAIEKVAGTALAAYEHDHIFGPAGMTQTVVGAFPSGAGNATGYVSAKAGTPVAAYDPSWLYADGDIVSTAPDLARFDAALMSGTLITAQSFAMMRANPVSTGEEDAKYGLGVTLFPLADLTFVGHHGGVPGFEGDNEMLPDQKFAIVVLGNAFDFSTAKMNGPLLATLFPATSARAVAEQKRVAMTVAPGEDTALTARFMAFFQALQRGRVDRATVTDQMNAQLTAENLGSVAEQLAPLGTLQRLIFRSKADQGAGIVFRYTGVFGSKSQPMTFSLDKAGKIAGVFLR